MTKTVKNKDKEVLENSVNKCNRTKIIQKVVLDIIPETSYENISKGKEKEGFSEQPKNGNTSVNQSSSQAQN